MVFQDPGSSLNPRWPIGQSIAEPLTLHTDMDRTQRESRVKTLLEQVQLPAAMRNRFPISSRVGSASVSASRGRWRWSQRC